MEHADLKTLLWSSIEDYCGLWELVWEFNTLHPNNSFHKNWGIAYRGVLYSLSKEFIELFYCQEPYGNMTRINGINSYVDFLQDPKIWEPPLSRARSVRISATKAGEQYYHDTLTSTQ